MALVIVVYSLCILCPWQLYFPALLPGSASLVQWLIGLLLIAVTLRSLLDPNGRRIPVTLPILLLVAFIALSLLAVIWSPDPLMALKTVVKLGAIPIIAWGLLALSAPQRRRAVMLLGGSAAILASLVVAFRVVPVLELGYWYSPLAVHTIDPDVLTEVRTGALRANILAPDRAGAVFSNVNAASLFLGIVLYLVLSTVPATRSRTVIAGVLVAGVLATGSKAGLAALALTGTVWVALNTPRRVSLLRSAGLLAGSLAAIIGFAWLLAGQGLGGAAGVSFESRTAIWSVALPILIEHPVNGLGFGGWALWAEENLRHLGLSVAYPPHNLLLIGWSWTGILGAAVLGAFLTLTLWQSWTRGARPGTGGQRVASVGLFCAFAWFAIQSMFTNAAVTDIRIGIPLGISLAALAALTLPPKQQLQSEREAS